MTLNLLYDHEIYFLRSNTVVRNELKNERIMSWGLCFSVSIELFHGGGPYHIETNTLICRANQWTGFCMIGTFVMKELKYNSIHLIHFHRLFSNKCRWTSENTPSCIIPYLIIQLKDHPKCIFNILRFDFGLLRNCQVLHLKHANKV